MGKNYTLPILPQDIILFLDTSIFCLNDTKEIYPQNDTRYYSRGFLKENHSRLVELTQKIESMDNWTTINSILDEFAEGIGKFQCLLKKTKSSQLGKLYSRIIKKMDKLLQILDDKERIADNHYDYKSIQEMKTNYPKIKELFKNLEKNPSEVDIKLINYALTYTKNEKVSIYSQDQNLLQTYSRFAMLSGISNNAHIVSDKIGKNINVLNFNPYDQQPFFQKPKQFSRA